MCRLWHGMVRLDVTNRGDTVVQSFKSTHRIVVNWETTRKIMLNTDKIGGGDLMQEFQFTHFVQVGCDVVGKAGLVEEESKEGKRMCFVEFNKYKGIALFALVDRSCLKPMESEEVIE